MTTIMVIEDNASLISLYQRVLRAARVEIVTATTLDQAQRELVRSTPTLILLDMGIPDGNGLSMIDFIQAQPHLATTKVIVISGNRQYQQEAEARGVEYFLYKPVPVTMLIQLLERVLYPLTFSAHSEEEARALRRCTHRIV